MNAPMEWGGAVWATYIWDLVPPDDAQRRGQLMLHELFHRIQPQLGLLAEGGPNDHLDTLDGRYWLRLEWRALAQAIRSSPGRTQALRDALAFRAARRAAFPDAAQNERADEIREGLAQYTGTVSAAASASEVATSAVAQLADAETQPSFVRTFAYASGLGYGVLLDLVSPGWTRSVRAMSDLGQLLQAAAALQPSENVAEATARYQGPQLRIAEEARDAEQEARVAELRERFVNGPVLAFPKRRGAAFDTRGVTPLPGSGTIYTAYKVGGEWGSFETTTGVLVSTETDTLAVPAPTSVEGPGLSGSGWTLKLAPGWSVRPGPRPTDFQVVRESR